MCVRRMLALLSILVLFGSFSGAAAWQNEKKPEPQERPLRLKTNLIQARAVVTDKSGKLIDNLKKDDFELLENGRPQDISFFSMQQISAAPSSPPQTPQTPAETGRANTPFSPVRTIVLFVDAVHLTIADLPLVKQALRRFVDEQMTDSDLVAMVTNGGALGVLEQFTRDRDVLRRAIDRLTPMGSAAIDPLTPYLSAMVTREASMPTSSGGGGGRGARGRGAAIGSALPGGSSSGAGEATQLAIKILDAKEGPMGSTSSEVVRAQTTAAMVLAHAAWLRKTTLSMINAVIDRMASLPGQRIIALFSPGFSLQEYGIGLDTSDLRAVTSRAVRAGVIIYSIDAAGLQPSSDYDAETQVPQGHFATDAQLDDRNVLSAIAADSGGEFYTNTNDLGKSLQRALEGNQLYYDLAYYAAIEKNDNKLRRILIRVKGHPDYKVRAQKGYIPAELFKRDDKEAVLDPRQQVFQAMASPLPMTDIGLAVSADVLRRAENEVSVSVQSYIDASALAYREQGEKHAFALDVFTSVFDAQGKLAGGFEEKLEGDLSADTFTAAKENGLVRARRLSLRPGLYNIRVGIREASTGKIGTAISWVEVPDYTKNKLTMSSVLLSALLEKAGQPEANPFYQPQVSQGIKVYKRGAKLAFAAMIYTAAQGKLKPGDAQVQIEVLKGNQTALKSAAKPASAWQSGEDKNGVEIGAQFPVDFPPGLYELRLTASDPKSKAKAVRSATFRVVL